MCEIRLSQLNCLFRCRCDTSKVESARGDKTKKTHKNKSWSDESKRHFGKNRASGSNSRAKCRTRSKSSENINKLSCFQSRTAVRQNKGGVGVYVSGSLSWNRIGWKLSQLSVSRLMTRGKRITLMEHNRLLRYPVCPETRAIGFTYPIRRLT